MEVFVQYGDLKIKLGDSVIVTDMESPYGEKPEQIVKIVVLDGEILLQLSRSGRVRSLNQVELLT